MLPAAELRASAGGGLHRHRARQPHGHTAHRKGVLLHPHIHFVWLWFSASYPRRLLLAFGTIGIPGLCYKSKDETMKTPLPLCSIFIQLGTDAGPTDSPRARPSHTCPPSATTGDPPSSTLYHFPDGSPFQVPPELVPLLRQLLQEDPSGRPTAEQPMCRCRIVSDSGLQVRQNLDDIFYKDVRFWIVECNAKSRKDNNCFGGPLKVTKPMTLISCFAGGGGG